jgi:hypothetical protein
MFKVSGEPTTLAALREQSVALSLHARRLRQEFTELLAAAKVLRIESLQLQEDVRMIKRSAPALFVELD